MTLKEELQQYHDDLTQRNKVLHRMLAERPGVRSSARFIENNRIMKDLNKILSRH